KFGLAPVFTCRFSLECPEFRIVAPEFTHHFAAHFAHARPVFTMVAPAFTRRLAHECPEFTIVVPACTVHFALDRPALGGVGPTFQHPFAILGRSVPA